VYRAGYEITLRRLSRAVLIMRTFRSATVIADYVDEARCAPKTDRLLVRYDYCVITECVSNNRLRQTTTVSRYVTEFTPANRRLACLAPHRGDSSSVCSSVIKLYGIESTT